MEEKPVHTLVILGNKKTKRDVKKLLPVSEIKKSSLSLNQENFLA